MSLRWIQETQEAPTCDEESSDIDDSCSDDSYDTDVSLYNDDDNNDDHRQKRETFRHPTTTIDFDDNGTAKYITYAPPHIIWDPRQPAQNPIYGSLVIQLYCRTGYHLAIMPSGRVRGLNSNDEPHALLRVSSVSFGIIRIQSVETGLYLAFNNNGHLYGEPNVNKDNTEWEQWSIGSYDAFRSRKYIELGWWVGIQKNGRPKPGPKTAWGQKAIQFLPRTKTMPEY